MAAVAGASASQTPAATLGSMMLTTPAPNFKPDDTYIAVMGVTGAGKSTFISQPCPAAVAGHGLKSDQGNRVYTYEQNGKTIHLIDTPGFDDTYKSDTDVLKDLAYYLAKSYGEGLLLTGIIYLHPITHNRVTGTAFKNLRTFRKLCGEQGMKSVILVTTMWEDVDPNEGARRARELVDTPEFWGDMKRAGSEVKQHRNNKESAAGIITFMLAKGTKTVLGLQTEMVDLHRSLEDTEAGKEVDQEMNQQRELFEQRLEKTKRELEEAIEEKDQAHVDEILKEQANFETKLAAIQKGRDELRISMEKLIAEKDKEHAEEMMKVKEQLTGAQEGLKKQIEEYENFKKFQEAKNEQHEAERKEAEEKCNALQQYANEADQATLAMLLGVVVSEEKGKRLEQEAKMKEVLMLLELQKRAQASAPPSYQESVQPVSYPQQQYRSQSGYDENIGASVGAGVGAVSGIALGGAAALGLCNIM